MTKQEFSIIAQALRTFYPAANLLPNEKAMSLWFSQLADIPYNVIQAAVYTWVPVNKWPPTIADLREQCKGVLSGDDKDWSEAWEDVRRAVRRYGYYNAEEALASLDDLTREAVKRLGFKEVCLSSEISVYRANFRMVYEQLKDRKKKKDIIPEGVIKAIEQIRKEQAKLTVNEKEESK